MHALRAALHAFFFAPWTVWARFAGSYRTGQCGNMSGRHGKRKEGGGGGGGKSNKRRFINKAVRLGHEGGASRPLGMSVALTPRQPCVLHHATGLSDGTSTEEDQSTLTAPLPPAYHRRPPPVGR